MLKKKQPNGYYYCESSIIHCKHNFSNLVRLLKHLLVFLSPPNTFLIWNFLKVCNVYIRIYP
uniref:Uncharacterized protein n=1 Tax=Naja naja TaxID=35670 RepID=A0A8C6V4J9_NAJNA